MRLGRSCVLWFGLAGCSPPVTEPIGDPLTLEVGGEHRVLAEVLQERGVIPVPPRVASNPAPMPTRTPPRSSPAAPRRPAAQPGPDPEPQLRTVRLARGDTLIGLCRQWLGDGERWREVMALNGWTERQLKRLPVGATVKLPAQ